MSLPRAVVSENLSLIAHHSLDGSPNVGEGMAMKVTPDGRRILYVAGEYPPTALSILDVTEPSDPELLLQLPTEHEGVRGNSIALSGDTLLLAKQVAEFGMTPAGFHVFDISVPEAPTELAFFDTSGEYSKGVHFVCTDGRYAHISTGAPDFEPKNPEDHQFYMIVDLIERESPREVGRWWIPGQRAGDEETIDRHEVNDFAFRPHHTLCYPQRPDRAYLGYIDGGIVTLDISDPGRPQLIKRLDYHPPATGFTHTVVPLFERNLLIVAEEAISKLGDYPKRCWIVDVRDETNPLIISSLPFPPGAEDRIASGARIGAHNVHENEPEPGSALLQNTCVATWFAEGVRIYDIRDPYTPREIAAFVPEVPDGQPEVRINDVFVDDRGYLYVGDRAKGGLYILRYDGDVPLS